MVGAVVTAIASHPCNTAKGGVVPVVSYSLQKLNRKFLKHNPKHTATDYITLAL